jgi:uncharacterized protein (DUF2132 family)
VQEFLFLLRKHPDARDASGRLLRELHGVTLKDIVEKLLETYGWPGLAERIPLDCFALEPSVKSSLTFLRRTDWAREKVEKLYVAMRTAEVLSLPQP